MREKLYRFMAGRNGVDELTRMLSGLVLLLFVFGLFTGHNVFVVLSLWYRLRKRVSQMRDYRFYRCPSCRQTVRVPKGHGRIEISCPKCREKFIRRS